MYDIFLIVDVVVIANMTQSDIMFYILQRLK